MENTYDKLIDLEGQPHFGVFSRPVKYINHQDFHYLNVMDKPTHWLGKHFDFNQFQFIGVTGEDFIFGCALVDIKYVGNAFVYLYDRGTRQLKEYSFLMPLAINTHLTTTPDDGESYFKRGNVTIRLSARDNPRQRTLSVKIGDEFHADIKVTEPAGYQPLSLCTKTGFSGWTYTQKAAGLDVQGSLTHHRNRYDIGTAHKASYDWSCGFMRRETAWNWACLSGTSSEGHTLGVNFANGVNETGYTENAFWVDGQLIKVNQVRFIYPKNRRQSQWLIQSDDGKVDLKFEPEGSRQEKINMIVLATNFTQLFGRFYGTLKDDAGTLHTLNGVAGFAEDHYAKW